MNTKSQTKLSLGMNNVDLLLSHWTMPSLYEYHGDEIICQCLIHVIPPPYKTVQLFKYLGPTQPRLHVVLVNIECAAIPLLYTAFLCGYEWCAYSNNFPRMMLF